MQNSVEIFSIALGLVEPWFVKEVVFDKERLQLDIFLGFKKGHKFLMGDEQYYTAHDTVERRWEHLNFFQHKCFLHCNVPKLNNRPRKRHGFKSPNQVYLQKINTNQKFAFIS